MPCRQRLPRFRPQGKPLLFGQVAGQHQEMRRVESVAKYLILWEIDPARVPVNAKERDTTWLAFAEMVKADIKKGITKDWGAFTGELKGYSIGEGTEVSIMTQNMQYTPYVKYEVHPIASLAQVEEAIKASIK
jgi:hypothetical protein